MNKTATSLVCKDKASNVHGFGCFTASSNVPRQYKHVTTLCYSYTLQLADPKSNITKKADKTKKE